MRAVVFDGSSLELTELPKPQPGPGEILIEVAACGVCRTDLHIVDGELDKPKLPLVPGHQIVGRVVGDGRRVGVPWLGWTDGDVPHASDLPEPQAVEALDAAAPAVRRANEASK